MPNEEKFCPSFWRAEEFEADGDYYYDNIKGQWTNIEITKRSSLSNDSTLGSRQKNRNYEPSIQEVEDLRRYIDYKLEGRYSHDSLINEIEDICVISLCFETYNIEDYKEFLYSVYRFLNFSNGVLANWRELDALSFKKEFVE